MTEEQKELYARQLHDCVLMVIGIFAFLLSAFYWLKYLN